MKLLTILFLVACTTEPQLTSDEQPLGGFTDCSVPGAIPDDGLDDRTAIQTALTTKGCALLGPGVYDAVTTYPRDTSLDRFNVIKLGVGRSLRGMGPATILRFSGDAHGSDLYGVGLAGDDSSVSDLAIDMTGGLTGTSEQTHAVQVTGPALRTSVKNVWINLPSLGSGAGGDCIRVVGYDPQPDGSLDKRVSLEVNGVHFQACDRSGIAVHSGLSSGTFSNNIFYNTGDSDIDLEGNGGAIVDLSITGNVFKHTPADVCSVSLGAESTKHAVFAGNVVDGARLCTYNIDQLSIVGNHFTVPGKAIEMVKISKQVVISGNTIESTSSTTTYSSITSLEHATGKPGSITVANNQITTVGLNGTALGLISALDVTVTGNTIVWSPTLPASTTVNAMSIYGIAQRTESILVANNVIRGPYNTALSTTNSYVANGGGFKSVSFLGNIMRGVGAGLKCALPDSLTVAVVAGNSGATSPCTVATVGN